MKIIQNTHAIAKLFNATFLINLMHGNEIKAFENTIKISKVKENKTIKDILNHHYQLLLKYYRTEYVYKNLLISNIKNTYQDQQFSMISEQNVGLNSRIDLSFYAKTNIAYEIKTELDTVNRLDKQLFDYSNAFEFVNVFTSESKVKSIQQKIDKRFGILYLNKENEIIKLQEASSNIDNITHEGIYSLLKQKEIILLLKKYYGYMPYDFSTVTSRKEIRNLFQSIEIDICLQYAVEILKYRMQYNKAMNILNQIPSSLLSIGLNTRIQNESKEFINFLDLSINELHHHMGMMQHRKLF